MPASWTTHRWTRRGPGWTCWSPRPASTAGWRSRSRPIAGCLAQRQGREVSLAEAAAAWYDDVYLPVIQIVRDYDLLSGFPGRSEADLFMWVSERQEDVEEEIGWTVRPERVAGELANGRSRRRRASDVQESASLRNGAGALPQLDPMPLDTGQ